MVHMHNVVPNLGYYASRAFATAVLFHEIRLLGLENPNQHYHEIIQILPALTVLSWLGAASMILLVLSLSA